MGRRGSSKASPFPYPPAHGLPCSAATAWARRRCLQRSPARRAAMTVVSAWAAPTSPACRAPGGRITGLGYVPQTRDVFPTLTVEENLSVGLKDRPKSCLTGSLRHVSASQGAPQKSRLQLSGGEQQMLSTARTILGRPSVLLLDEPLEGLAPVICEELMARFRQARQDRRHDHPPGRTAHSERTRFCGSGNRPRAWTARVAGDAAAPCSQDHDAVERLLGVGGLH